MRSKIIIFCGIVLAACLWLVLYRLAESPKGKPSEIQTPTNQPPTQVVMAKLPVVQQAQPPSGTQQSAPPTGMELYNQMRSNLLSPERKQRAEQLQKEWQTPIEFYGIVVDESTNPVPGVQVNFECNDLSSTGTSYYHTESDTSGLFSIKDITGKLLSVHVNKEGYYSSKEDNDSFYYAGQNQNFVPDQNNPVVFHLRKKGAGATLIEKQFPSDTHIVQLHHDGTPVNLDLLNGMQAPLGNGQLQLEFWRDISNRNAAVFGWKFQLSAPGGGLIPTDEEFPFTAPQTGYQPSIVINMPATNQNWIGELRTKYYIQLPNGDYGRFDLYLLPYNGVFTVSSAINPTGSQNLEPVQ